MNEKIKKSVIKTSISLWKMFPIILGTIFLIALLLSVIPKEYFGRFVGDNSLGSLLAAAVAGSLSAGNPVMSYIIGGELNAEGAGLIAITVFLVTWVTVGVVQFPAESMILGKKFALIRNITSFFSSFLVAVITVYIYLWIK